MSNKIQSFQAYTLLSVGFPIQETLTVDLQEEQYQADVQEFKDNLELQGLTDVVRIIPYRVAFGIDIQIKKIGNIDLPIQYNTKFNGTEETNTLS